MKVEAIKIIFESLVKNKALAVWVTIAFFLFFIVNVFHFYLLGTDHSIAKYVWWNDFYNLINNVLIGLLISYIIYLLVTYLPQRN